MAGDKKKKFGIERKPEPEPAPELERKPEPERKAMPKPGTVYVVAKGCTLYGKRGVLYPGQAVTVDDFGGRESDLLARVTSGHIIPKG